MSNDSGKPFFSVSVMYRPEGKAGGVYMPNLDANRNRALAGLIREHARLIHGLTAAKALLGLCEEKVFPISRLSCFRSSQAIKRVQDLSVKSHRGFDPPPLTLNLPLHQSKWKRAKTVCGSTGHNPHTLRTLALSLPIVRSI
jgi:hypothetical protein